MRAVVQRVSRASVRVDGDIVSDIGNGLLVLLGVGEDDDDNDLEYMLGKILGLRIFEDDDGKMNLSIRDVKGKILVVSQFTLYGDVRKGRRPSFSTSARPDIAEDIYEKFVARCKDEGIEVGKGVFGADMDVELINDGPVTILIDSKKVF
ncbi:MAG: D-tyrosyl-tRNA(Tyr) deacylase [Tissierellia bacterium]|nr:D-tyrosyl-tRNA(Tyr) deacylase [Tissierellia bacterium]